MAYIVSDNNIAKEIRDGGLYARNIMNKKTAYIWTILPSLFYHCFCNLYKGILV